MKKEYDFSKGKRLGKEGIKKYSTAKVPISIRVALKDLVAIQAEAERLGLPYQTLINSILHQYINGQLTSAKKLKITAEN